MVDLDEHLAWWGLRHVESDEAYFRWQQEMIPAQDLAELNRLAEAKRAPGADPALDVAFYDYAARPTILPVLQSQRYEYYQGVGGLVAERLASLPSGCILDFGCGVGILTTFYARRCPQLVFVGVDRSPASIAAATERAGALGLRNLRFECLDLASQVPAGPPDGSFDAVVCTHALLQAEQDPGLFSRDWRTFERPQDAEAQADFERRTGLGPRLDALRRLLAPDGRLVVFEKSRRLARRVPFQRALAARGLTLLESPVPLRYRLVEDVVDDGPLYVLGPSSGSPGPGSVAWSEDPEADPGEDLFRCRSEAAKFVWGRLPAKKSLGERRRPGGAHGAIQIEWGESAGVLAYLYVATDDRLQVLLVGGQGVGTITRAVELATSDDEALVALVEALGLPSGGEEPPPEQTPLYENHGAIAQLIHRALLGARILEESTVRTPAGVQKHVEVGELAGLRYLYLATTADERQLLLVERERGGLLTGYYRELTASSDLPLTSASGCQ
ncbi:class I SAM-dependent methyltransferase [Nitrospira sp. Kam-Ns4a]